MKLGYFRSYWLPTKAQMATALNEFAELLSTDLFTLPEIAKRMEISVGTACVLLHDLCGLYDEAVVA